MIAELDTVVLEEDIPEHGLAKGDVGTVVFRYPTGDSYEVEFLTAEGSTVAVLTLGHSDIRPPAEGEIFNARRLRPV
jgi:uncharacterized protein DUF4926